ncbi:MAG: PD-(D/E)XK nuclease family protein [Bacilli bacterium]|nr:PD-(D/E)XK nuclease family protein [Bacilli bacterium]
MREKVIIVESYLHRVILPSFQKEEKITFLSPSEIQEAFLGRVDQKILFDIYQNEGKKNYFLSKYYAQAALNYKKRDKSESDVEKDIAAIASRTNFHPNPIKAQLLKGKEIYIHPASYSEGLVQLLEDNGFRAELFHYQDVEDESVHHDLIYYPDIKQETLECLNAIGLLLSSDEKLMADDIGICCSSDYLPHLSYFADVMNIRLSYPDYSFKDTAYCKEALEMIASHKVEEVKDLEGHNEREREFYALLKQKLNEYLSDGLTGDDYDVFLAAKLKDDFDTSYSDSDGGVKVASSLTSLTKKGHVFFLGLDSSVPSVTKNTDFLNDAKKEAFTYMPLSYEKNAQKRSEFIQLINYFGDRIRCSFFDNICFSNVNDDERNVSTFIDDNVLFRLVKSESVIQKERFSLEADKIMYSTLEDNYQGYGEDSVYYRSMLEQFKKKETYYPDNENPSFEFDLDDKNFNLSFTSMSNYFKCPYSFLLAKGYKLKESAEDFVFDKGNIAHKVFENHTNGVDEDFETTLKSVINSPYRDVSQLSGHDHYYLNRFYDAAKATIPYLDRFLELTKLDIREAEKNIEGNLGKIKWNGKIDFLGQDQDGNFVILDYKSGSHPFSYDNAYFGYDFQLSFYSREITNQGGKPLGYYFVSPFQGGPEHLNKGFVPFKFSGVNYCAHTGITEPEDAQAKKPYILDRVLVEEEKDELESYLPMPSGQFTLNRERIDELEKRLEENLKEIQDTVENTHKYPVRSHHYVNEAGQYVDEGECKYCRFKDCCFLNEESKKQVVPVLKQTILHKKVKVSEEGESNEQSN